MVHEPPAHRRMSSRVVTTAISILAAVLAFLALVAIGLSV